MKHRKYGEQLYQKSNIQRTMLAKRLVNFSKTKIILHSLLLYPFQILTTHSLHQVDILISMNHQKFHYQKVLVIVLKTGATYQNTFNESMKLEQKNLTNSGHFMLMKSTLVK